jgi:hypothetical protein
LGSGRWESLVAELAAVSRLAHATGAGSEPSADGAVVAEQLVHEGAEEADGKKEDDGS